MKMTLLISALLVGLISCGMSNTPETYGVKTVHYTVQQGDTGHQIAYKYIGKQDKYDDVREFWFYISKDSKLDRRLPLQVGQELTINLYKSRRQK